MGNPTQITSPIYSLLPTDIAGFDALAELALDLRWSWNHAADELWQQLDPALWQLTHNPWVVLQSASRHQIERCSNEPTFRSKASAIAAQLRGLFQYGIHVE